VIRDLKNDFGDELLEHYKKKPLILFLFSFTPGVFAQKLQITRNDCSHDNNDNVKGLFGRKKC
jgi:hypothetical protein